MTNNIVRLTQYGFFTKSGNSHECPVCVRDLPTSVRLGDDQVICRQDNFLL